MSQLIEIGLTNAALATGLAVLAAAVERLGRRPALGHALWLLVLIKLITPPLVGLPVPWPAAPRPAVVTPEKAAPHAKAPAASARPAQAAAIKIASRVSHPSPRGEPLRKAAPSPRRAWPSIDWGTWLTRAWLAGSAAWFAVLAARIARFRALLAHAGPASENLQLEVEHLAGRLGLARCPEVRVLPVRVSPLVWSLGGATVLVLPERLIERLGAKERATLLAHELAHLRRGDHWTRLLEMVALGLYWWHPAAWWARRAINRAEESCCDAWVVATLPGSAMAYAKALLKTVDFLSEARPALPPAASGVGPISNLRRRVTMILRGPSHHRLSWPARLGAAALGLLVLPLGPRPVGAVISQDPEKTSPGDPAAARDLERRLEQLERKLDRLAELRGSDTEKPGRPKKARAAKPDKPDKPGKPDRPGRLDVEVEEKIEAAVDPERMEELGKRIEVLVEGALDEQKLEQLGEQIEKAVEKAMDPEKLEALGEQIEKAVEGAIDEEKLESLGEQIEKAVEAGMDPEKLEALGKEIQAVVEGSIDVEKIEALGKQIEESMKQQFDPAKMAALGKEIEESVRKGIDPEKMEALGKEIEAAVKNEFTPERIEALKRAAAAAEGKVEEDGRVIKKLKERPVKEDAKDAHILRLERRIRELEERLNRDLEDEDEDEENDDADPQDLEDPEPDAA